jgi:hypothetical protein
MNADRSTPLRRPASLRSCQHFRVLAFAAMRLTLGYSSWRDSAK